MPIGGFNGSDPSPTLAEFKAYVAAGKIHYFIASNSGAGGTQPGGAQTDGAGGTQPGGSNSSSAISDWVSSTFTSTTIGGVTLYDLTQTSN